MSADRPYQGAQPLPGIATRRQSPAIPVGSADVPVDGLFRASQMGSLLGDVGQGMTQFAAVTADRIAQTDTIRQTFAANRVAEEKATELNVAYEEYESTYKGDPAEFRAGVRKLVEGVNAKYKDREGFTRHQAQSIIASNNANLTNEFQVKATRAEYKKIGASLLSEIEYTTQGMANQAYTDPSQYDALLQKYQAVADSLKGYLPDNAIAKAATQGIGMLQAATVQGLAATKGPEAALQYMKDNPGKVDQINLASTSGVLLTEVNKIAKEAAAAIFSGIETSTDHVVGNFMVSGDPAELDTALKTLNELTPMQITQLTSEQQRKLGVIRSTFAAARALQSSGLLGEAVATSDGRTKALIQLDLLMNQSFSSAADREGMEKVVSLYKAYVDRLGTGEGDSSLKAEAAVGTDPVQKAMWQAQNGYEIRVLSSSQTKQISQLARVARSEGNLAPLLQFMAKTREAIPADAKVNGVSLRSIVDHEQLVAAGIPSSAAGVINLTGSSVDVQKQMEVAIMSAADLQSGLTEAQKKTLTPAHSVATRSLGGLAMGLIPFSPNSKEAGDILLRAGRHAMGQGPNPFSPIMTPQGFLIHQTKVMGAPTHEAKAVSEQLHKMALYAMNQDPKLMYPQAVEQVMGEMGVELQNGLLYKKGDSASSIDSYAKEKAKGHVRSQLPFTTAKIIASTDGLGKVVGGSVAGSGMFGGGFAVVGGKMTPLSKMVVTTPYGTKRQKTVVENGVKKTVSVPHNAIDVAMEKGTGLVWGEDFTVSSMGSTSSSGGYGNFVDLVSSDGQRKIRLAHLDNLNGISNGMVIRKGQNILRSGNTGRSTGPHLHMEFFLKGKNGAWEKQDPTPYLKAQGDFKPAYSPPNDSMLQAYMTANPSLPNNPAQWDESQMQGYISNALVQNGFSDADTVVQAVYASVVAISGGRGSEAFFRAAIEAGNEGFKRSSGSSEQGASNKTSAFVFAKRAAASLREQAKSSKNGGELLQQAKSLEDALAKIQIMDTQGKFKVKETNISKAVSRGQIRATYDVAHNRYVTAYYDEEARSWKAMSQTLNVPEVRAKAGIKASPQIKAVTGERFIPGVTK